MKSGVVFKIYDYAGGAMVMETGDAYAARPYVPAKGEKPSLKGLWAAIAPEEPMPATLAALNARVDGGKVSAPAMPVTHQKSKVVPTSATPGGGVSTNAAEGCNNGCCDYEWMYTSFPVCNQDFDTDWMDYNYGYEWHNADDTWYYESFVCAAIGTTTYEWQLGGANSGYVQIPETHFYHNWWQASVNWAPWGSSFNDEDLWAFVNEPLAQHLNTWCGGADTE